PGPPAGPTPRLDRARNARRGRGERRERLTMILLHAGIDSGLLLLWGEVPADVLAARPPRRGKGPIEAQPYPYDPGAAPRPPPRAPPARPWVCAGSPPAQAAPGAARPLVAGLPAVKGRPVPSSPLISEPPPANAQPDLLPWNVTALRLRPQQALELLCA